MQELIARVYRSRRGNGITYLPIRSIPVKSPDKLRIAVHDKTILFLYSDTDSDEEKVLAEYPLGSDLSINYIMLNTQASGANRLTDVTYKSLTLYRKPPPATAPLPK